MVIGHSEKLLLNRFFDRKGFPMKDGQYKEWNGEWPLVPIVEGNLINWKDFFYML